MFNLVPVNMLEVKQKLEWSLSNNIKTNEEQIIIDALKENVQSMVNDVLEGPYWTVKWVNDDLEIPDISQNFIENISMKKDTLIQKFKNNAPVLIQQLFKEVQRIVKQN
ncbi:hypothetical protein [Companilactobacillus sp. DQM5]|uniref:hypothetical protein n=1 Tax=Companilactobacillus sp. DQM5 TaxID=3463359 RepID=UPI004058C70E